LRFLKLVGNGWILNFQNLVLRLAGLIAGLRKLVLEFPRLILRFQTLLSAASPWLRAFLQSGLRVSNFILKFLKLFFGFARLVLSCQGLVFRFLNLGPERRVAVCVSRAWFRPRGFAAGLPAIAAGLLRPDSVLPGPSVGLRQSQKVAFLFTPP